jgi:anti-sigma regulatory factor (Ser/Thr protein kinase)
MPAVQDPPRNAAHETTTVSATRIPRAASAPSVARRYVREAVHAGLPPACFSEIELLTSELVTNVIEHSSVGPVEVSVVTAHSFTRVEVRGSGDGWGRGPSIRVADELGIGGRGLFLVDRLSDRWGVDDDEPTVWFEFDHHDVPGP